MKTLATELRAFSAPDGKTMLPIPAGEFLMGSDEFGPEQPPRQVYLPDYYIDQFPVTNAEYKLFIEAGAYADEQWWDTPEALAWLRGEGSTEGSKWQWRETRKFIQKRPEEYYRQQVTGNIITSEQAAERIEIRNWTDELCAATANWRP